MVTTAEQAPAPLQVAAAVSEAGVVVLPGVHMRLRQPCAVPWNWQRAAPSAFAAVLLPAHRPFSPHVIGFATATQALVGSGSTTPAAIAVHVPVELRQVSQVPLQALVQQVPGVPSDR